MERLGVQKRASILRCLIEGNSILATSRITGAAKNSIVRVLAEAGEACTVYQDDHMRDLPCKLLQLDEIWSFVGCREKTKEVAKRQHPGDVWTWTAICADTKLIPCWRVGDRSGTTAFEFCSDLSGRFTGLLQINSDGHNAYRWAVGANFPGVDFGQLIKIYGTDEHGRDVVVRTEARATFGTPVMELISTSYVERSNLTIRMSNRRFTRLTNAFSKKLENHCHMLAVMFMNYNFCRKHMTLKTTPALKAGIADHQWSLEDVVEMIDGYLAAKAASEFEAAFAAKFTQPVERRTYEPQTPLVPWYLDPDSGGRNPEVRKPGVDYDC